MFYGESGSCKVVLIRIIFSIYPIFRHGARSIAGCRRAGRAAGGWRLLGSRGARRTWRLGRPWRSESCWRARRQSRAWPRIPSGRVRLGSYCSCGPAGLCRILPPRMSARPALRRRGCDRSGKKLEGGQTERESLPYRRATGAAMATATDFFSRFPQGGREASSNRAIARLPLARSRGSLSQEANDLGGSQDGGTESCCGKTVTLRDDSGDVLISLRVAVRQHAVAAVAARTSTERQHVVVIQQKPHSRKGYLLTAQRVLKRFPSVRRCSRADRMGAFVIAFAMVIHPVRTLFSRHGMQRRRESNSLYLGDGSERIPPDLGSIDED